jgi:hypothetical protein
VTGRITAQSQTEHTGGYFTLRNAIRVEDGEIEVVQRLPDTAEGYALGKARVECIAAALVPAAANTFHTVPVTREEILARLRRLRDGA